jgi:hypothetical protein
MSRINDVGGMHGFPPIEQEPDELDSGLRYLSTVPCA